MKTKKEEDSAGKFYAHDSAYSLAMHRHYEELKKDGWGLRNLSEQHVRAAILSCSKKKNFEIDSGPAKDIYNASSLFRKAYKVISESEEYDAIFILSDRYGRILPDTEIVPYEVDIKKWDKDTLRTWSRDIAAGFFYDWFKLRTWHEDLTLEFFCGKRHRELVIHFLKEQAYTRDEEYNIDLREPLASLTIGKQLACWDEAAKNGMPWI